MLSQRPHFLPAAKLPLYRNLPTSEREPRIVATGKEMSLELYLTISKTALHHWVSSLDSVSLEILSRPNFP